MLFGRGGFRIRQSVQQITFEILVAYVRPR
jgi:hypothetical protein